MTAMDVRRYVDDRPADGVFRVHRGAFADPSILELEQKFIFERTWMFLALESQVAAPNDFVTCHIGRTPVLVARDAAKRLGAYVNVCRHKGAIVCRAEQGNSRYHVCPYHGWVYDASGRNVDVKDRAAGGYSGAFDTEDHDLVPLPRLASYKGLVFGSLSADVPPLEEFLGGMRFFIDCAMEQGPAGMELVPGRAVYTYRGNWKLQMDNGLDGYHLTSTHGSYMEVQARRRGGAGHAEARQFDWDRRAGQKGGMFDFPHGHTAIWFEQMEPEKRPISATLDEVRARVGELRAEWMLRARNTGIFPGMQIADTLVLILRTFRPLAVDRTEMRGYCLAPIGEAPEVRSWRLRQVEDFFNPAGLATPDDTAVYEECQRGFGATEAPWLQGYARGIAALTDGPNEVARELGIAPAKSVLGTFQTQVETGLHAPYREWARLIEAGLAGRKAYP